MQRLNIATLGCFLLILFLTACNLFSPPPNPPTPTIPPVVGGNDVVADPSSGQCYRLVYIPATDHYPAAVVTTDGVDCPSGVGRNR